MCDQFIAAMACVESTTHFEWANWKMMNQYATDFLNNIPQVLNSEFFIVLDQLLYQN